MWAFDVESSWGNCRPCRAFVRDLSFSSREQLIPSIKSRPASYLIAFLYTLSHSSFYTNTHTQKMNCTTINMPLSYKKRKQGSCAAFRQHQCIFFLCVSCGTLTKKWTEASNGCHFRWILFFSSSSSFISVLIRKKKDGISTRVVVRTTKYINLRSLKKDI